ncbi:hypothetical protein BKA61DRAFT_741607 [Leptodontidium sp. MPI-SDFR-AT-0119]|nr:hypothetical protein BKA61DRAFT_741607 [Leptodontidium sp. MPI-SDFR-AT-0119]
MSLVVAGIYLTPSIWATPTPNLTALRTTIAPAWVDEPSDRGTWGILYSCSFTLLLCVYTAIHLNVPGHYDTQSKIWWRKAKWVAIAIFGPEIVVYVAFEQWYLAKMFLRDLRRIADESTDEKFKKWYNDNSKKPPFDMVYAHYVLMGGFVVNVEDMHNTYTIITFTTNGILYLAKHGHFCKISRGDIDDKSKADLLAKSLVCVQVLWVIGQAIERKAAGYPITLLELHTVVHVVCALLMYALWFQKPLNVQKPTILDLREDLDLVAHGLQLAIEIGPEVSLKPLQDLPFSLREGHLSQRLPSLGPGELDFHPPQLRFVWYDDTRCFTRTTSTSHGQPQDDSSVNLEPISILTHNSLVSPDSTGALQYNVEAPPKVLYAPAGDREVVCTLFSGQSLMCGVGPNFFGGKVYVSMSVAVSLSQRDINRLELVSRFFKRIVIHRDRFYTYLYFGINLGYPNNTYKEIFRYRIVNLSWEMIYGILDDKLYLCVAMAVIPAAYGCVHLAALSVEFPTAVEKLLWEISCFYLAGAAAALALVFALLYLDELAKGFLISQIHRLHLNPRDTMYTVFPTLQQLHTLSSHGKVSWYLRLLFLKCWIRIGGRRNQGPVRSPLSSLLLGWNDGIRRRFLSYSLLCIGGCVLLVYIPARIFLVIESFISLRHVPIGVYKTPSLNFFGNVPHL